MDSKKLHTEKTLNYSEVTRKAFIILSFLLCWQINSFACLWKTTGASSDWNSASAWTSSGSGCTGSIPSKTNIFSGDVVVIDHPITLTTTSINVKGNGTLIINSDLTVNGDVIFSNNSIVTINASGSLTINSNLTNNNNSDGVLIYGTVTVSGNVFGGNGSIIGPFDETAGIITAGGSITTAGSGTIFGSTADCIDSPDPCVMAGPNPLPVELIEFFANANSDFVELGWSTASEHNSSHFSIERSIDGKFWTKLGDVQASMNSNTRLDYWLTDSRPFTGLNYYRLTQVDYDGESVTYPAISIMFGSDLDINRVLLSPNPCYEEEVLTIKVSSAQESEFTLSLIDAQGQTRELRQIRVSKGNNTISLEGLNLKRGFYIVRIANDTFTFDTARLMVY